jgi:hypothetical protein
MDGRLYQWSHLVGIYLLASFSLSYFSGVLPWAIDCYYLSIIEYDLMQPIIGYQCLLSLHACGPDLPDRALGEIAPVAAIADEQGWVDFLWHYRHPVFLIRQD